LSGILFPLTDQERQQWQAEAEVAMKKFLAAQEPDQENQEQDTEPLPITVQEPTMVL